MREIRSSGSVRGASGDGRPYRARVSPVARIPAKIPSPNRQRSLRLGGRNWSSCPVTAIHRSTRDPARRSKVNHRRRALRSVADHAAPFRPWPPLGSDGRFIKKQRQQSRLGGGLLYQELGDSEVVHAAVAVGLPLMADHQVSGAPIENQPPCVYVAYTWPAPTSVELAFDSRHARSTPSLTALSISDRGAGRALVIGGDERGLSRSADRGCLRPADDPGGVMGRHLVSVIACEEDPVRLLGKRRTPDRPHRNQTAAWRGR
jgi:hypothetical protein